jgi:hypothetical protein
MSMKEYISGESVWRTPEESPPPLGVKMLLLNAGGVCVIGTWGNWATAWAPLPKVPSHIKEKLAPRRHKNDEWQLHAGDMA